jgi:hypothetical protein
VTLNIEQQQDEEHLFDFPIPLRVGVAEPYIVITNIGPNTVHEVALVHQPPALQPHNRQCEVRPVVQ